MTSPQRNDTSLFIPNVVLRLYYWFSFWNIHWNQSLSDVLTHCLFTCRFIRNLLYFYKPSSQRFCTVHISDPQARTFSEVGCLLIDFLLDGEDVRYNFCSKGSGVKGLVWGSVNNQARWHVQVKLFYFLFCFIFVFIFCFVLFLFLFLFFFKILMVGFDWKVSLSLNQASHYLSTCPSVCLCKGGKFPKKLWCCVGGWYNKITCF